MHPVGPLRFWLGAATLGALGVLLVFDHSRLDSPTMDEPFHTLAAAEYAIAGTYNANLEHPPLVKLLSGFAVRAAGARPPRMDEPFSMRTAEQPRPFAFSSSLPPERLFGAARAPVTALFFVLVLAVGGAVRRWGGAAAGLLAAALVAFEPNLVAHAGVVHTDLAAALGFFGTLTLCLLALEKRSLPLWAAAGAALGASLAAKFSCVLLVPMVAVLALVGLFRERRAAARDGRRPSARPAAGLLVAGVASAVVLLGCYAVAMRNMSPRDAEGAVRIFLASREAPPATVARVVSLSRISKEAGHYAAGLAGIALQNRTGGGVNFLRGTLSVDGFWDYFFVAFAVKSALGFLGVLAAGAALAAAKRDRLTLVVWALVLPAVYLFVTGMATSYNIGIRHMLPVYPLLAAAAVLAVFRALPVRAAAAVLTAGVAIQAAETLAVHPHEMSFFNAAAGGPSHGAAWLNDSNLDWGQDLARVSARLRAHGEERGTTVAYFGGADPAYYLPKARLFDGARDPLSPGRYAVSEFIRCCGPEAMAFHGDRAGAAGFERLRRALNERGVRLPREGMGYSIVLWELKEKSP
jgi:4-amino-4-deoxy-L-arabinose transferase-like glycosyltransferase